MNKRIKKKHIITRQNVYSIRVNVSKTHHPITITRDVKLLGSIWKNNCWYHSGKMLRVTDSVKLYRKPRYKYIKQRLPEIKHYPYKRKIVFDHGNGSC